MCCGIRIKLIAYETLPTANLCTTSLLGIDAQKPNYYDVFPYITVLYLDT